MPTINQRKRQLSRQLPQKLPPTSSRWTARRLQLGGLLLAALAVTHCGPPAPPMDTPPGDTSGPDRTPDRTPRQSFYEDNPTYISKAVDDGFWQTSTPAAQGLDESVLAGAASALAAQKSAYSMLIIRNGYLVTERYFNGSQASHSNNIHSASKSILSALVGIALDRGILSSLDQTVGQLLPQQQMKDPATARITLRHLLTMSSGLAWEEDNTEYTIEKTANWVQAILNLPLTSSPGTTFNYSTGNAHLIAAILTQASGQSLPAFATAALFNPLGITFEHWGKDPQGIASGGYNFYLTPRALARFAMMVFNGGKSGGVQIVPAAWLANSIRPEEPPKTGYHYGYLYWLPSVAGHAVAKMWGYGGQFAYLIPDANMVVVLTNNTAANYPEPDGDVFLTKYVLPAIRRR